MKLRDKIHGFDERYNSFHILDSHQSKRELDNRSHSDQDYIQYSYKKRQCNKLKEGDWFVYRHPGWATVDKRFEFYGGGRILKIGEADDEGISTATIGDSFVFQEPLKQRSPILETYSWKDPKINARRKGNSSWQNVFTQYGITGISKQDFFGLFGDIEVTGNFCESEIKTETIPEDKLHKTSSSKSNIFSVNMLFESSRMRASVRGKKRKLTYQIQPDLDNLSLEVSEVQTLGKEVILGLLKKMSEFEHSSVFRIPSERADAVGYDIEIEKSDGDTVCIAVKTTREDNEYGFSLSNREMSALHEKNDYRIYRLFNFNPEMSTADLKIYKAPFNLESRTW